MNFSKEASGLCEHLSHYSSNLNLMECVWDLDACYLEPPNNYMDSSLEQEKN